MIKNCQKYNETWDKIKILFKKEFDKEPLYNNKYISAKTKIYNDTINAEFKYKILKDNKHFKYIHIEPKNDDRYAYLSAILLDSILVDSDKHYPQIFLEKCLYAINKKILLCKYIDQANNEF